MPRRQVQQVHRGLPVPIPPPPPRHRMADVLRPVRRRSAVCQGLQGAGGRHRPGPQDEQAGVWGEHGLPKRYPEGSRQGSPSQPVLSQQRWRKEVSTMADLKGGYFGKMLEIDLSSGKTTVRALDEGILRDYIGGEG